MSMMSGGSTVSQTAIASDGYNQKFGLTMLTSLFFLWGFITCLNDILIPHLKNLFSLSYTQSMLIQFCFFGAYFIASIPAGNLVKKVGYRKGIVVGLLIAGLGCLLFIPAAGMQVYGIFLGALFVLACGVTVLQVAANPYVTVLGNPETASSRLNLTQAFNSLGTTVAPFFGAMLILSATAVSIADMSPEQLAIYKQSEADAVKLPYALLAGMFFVIAAIFAFLKLPEIKEKTDEAVEIEGSALHHRHLVLGAVGIFLYVGAEVAIGSFLISFLGESNIAGFTEAQAAPYVAYYWGGAMVGRFIGAAVMQRISAGAVLGFNAVCAAVLLVIAMLGEGSVAMWAILAIGLCNSVMFPTIFSLALKGLGPHTSQGSGILCLAIVGGAIVPVLQGMLADSIGIQLAFILPIACYLYICFYGLKGSRVVN